MTHVVDPSDFWVKRSKDIKNLKLLSEQLCKYKRQNMDIKNIPNSVAVGQYYLRLALGSNCSSIFLSLSLANYLVSR